MNRKNNRGIKGKPSKAPISKATSEKGKSDKRVTGARRNVQSSGNSFKSNDKATPVEHKKFAKKALRPVIERLKKNVRKSSVDIKKVEDNETRLNKYLASTGLCSRREADDLIKTGLITVNGNLITELGFKVKKGDDVRYNGERLKTERLVYLLLNKPKDYVTTVRDGHAARTVMDLVGRACKERIYPVGRLDKNTTGVLLFTNDGDLAKKLAHPSYNKLKIYHVTLDKGFSRSDINKIIEGITLDDGPVKADALNYIDAKSTKEVGIELHSGRNRIVRRIFEHLGYKVKKLDRVYFAGLTKKGLERGKYRFLTETEVAMLKMGSYK